MALLRSGGIHAFLQGGEHRALLGQFGRYIELRILVPRRELVRAEALLFALPVNDRNALDCDDEEDEDEEWAASLALRRRKPVYAAGLAFLLPFGAGHMYARNWILGLSLLLAQILFWIALRATGSPWWLLAASGVVVLDSVGAWWAAKRYNAKLALPEPAHPVAQHPYRTSRSRKARRH